MGDWYKNRLACCLSLINSSSIKLLLFIVPLILVSWFSSDLFPKTTGWILLSAAPPSSSYSSSVASNYTTDEKGESSHAEGSEGSAVDLYSTVVMVDAHHMEEALSEEAAALNLSSSPSLTVEAAVSNSTVQEMDGTKEDGPGISPTGAPNATATLNESIALPLKPTRPRVRTNLDRLEAGLQRARAAIKEAKNGSLLEDPVYVPVGPMYWDAKAFHRSYLEMEKQFKIFVYKEGEPPVFHDGPCKSIYSIEGNFIHKLDIDTQFQTKDPEKAHAFYLPFSVAKMVRFVYVRDSHDFGPIKRTVIDYVNLVGRKYPYWNRSLGADHFMLSCHDWGPEASFSLPHLHKNSIRALCNANTSEKFNPIKDVSIPEINLQTGNLNGLIGGPSPSRRPILAFFAGGVHGPIRPILLDYWEGKDEDMRIHKYLPREVSYYDMMRKSKYCICPSGYEVASPRIVEALYNGCVPVLISKTYVPPFSDILNWKSFSVAVPVDKIPNLKNILTSISPRQYIRMHRRVLQVRRHFEYNSPPKRFDVFHMILHSVWLRRLNVRISDDRGLMTD